MADHFFSVVSSTRKTRRHRVAQFYDYKGILADSYRVEIQNGPGNFRKFHISRREVDRNFRSEFPENFCSIRV